LTDSNGGFVSALPAVKSITYNANSPGGCGSDPTDPLETTATGHKLVLRQHREPVRLQLGDTYYAWFLHAYT
jgi:hypothetical protein